MVKREAVGLAVLSGVHAIQQASQFCSLARTNQQANKTLQSASYSRSTSA